MGEVDMTPTVHHVLSRMRHAWPFGVNGFGDSRPGSGGTCATHKATAAMDLNADGTLSINGNGDLSAHALVRASTRTTQP